MGRLIGAWAAIRMNRVHKTCSIEPVISNAKAQQIAT